MIFEYTLLDFVPPTSSLYVTVMLNETAVNVLDLSKITGDRLTFDFLIPFKTGDFVVAFSTSDDAIEQYPLNFKSLEIDNYFDSPDFLHRGIVSAAQKFSTNDYSGLFIRGTVSFTYKYPFVRNVIF